MDEMQAAKENRKRVGAVRNQNFNSSSTAGSKLGFQNFKYRLEKQITHKTLNRNMNPKFCSVPSGMWKAWV